MVCHPLAAPIPSPRLLSNLDEALMQHWAIFPELEFEMVKYYGGQHQIARRFRRWGFTIIPTKILWRHRRTSRFNPTYLVRSIEEGWVLVGFKDYECQELRCWKRLGWLDWIDPADAKIEIDKAHLPHDHFFEQIDMRDDARWVFENLKKIFERGEDWGWGNEGWRVYTPRRRTLSYRRYIFKWVENPEDAREIWRRQ